MSRADPTKIHLSLEKYNACGGEELFLSMEDSVNDVLLGFLRMRMPSEQAHRPEVTDETSIVRELHVYGPMMPIGMREDELWQHQGYGELLLAEAEKISREDYNKNNVLVTSGIGARDYYRKFGYNKKGPYMFKKLV